MPSTLRPALKWLVLLQKTAALAVAMKVHPRGGLGSPRCLLTRRRRWLRRAGVDVVLDEKPAGLVAGECVGAQAGAERAVRARSGVPGLSRLLVIHPDIRPGIVNDRLRVEPGRCGEIDPGRVVGRRREVLLSPGAISAREGAYCRGRARRQRHE